MENIKKLKENPIYYIKENTPIVVWEYYYKEFMLAVAEKSDGQSQANSFRLNFKNYSKGFRGFTSMYRLHFRFREVFQAVFPVTSELFFKGSFEEMKECAFETSKKMVIEFENILESQKTIK